MKRTTSIILFVILLLAVVVVVIVGGRQKNWYAEGRLLIQPDPNGSYNPFLYATLLPTISNVLCSSECSNELALASQVEHGGFALVRVHPVRSTRILLLQYVGSDSNGVERVAANACLIIQRFFSTNQPSLLVTNIDVQPYSPQSWWQRMYYGLPDIFRP